MSFFIIYLKVIPVPYPTNAASSEILQRYSQKTQKVCPFIEQDVKEFFITFLLLDMQISSSDSKFKWACFYIEIPSFSFIMEICVNEHLILQVIFVTAQICSQFGTVFSTQMFKFTYVNNVVETFFFFFL